MKTEQNKAGTNRAERREIMAEYKKLIPSFGIKEGQAVILDYGEEYYSNEIVALSRFYSDNGADELMIYDLSENDDDHERTIGLIKEAARTVDMPIITGGNVKRLEDVKKYLYAGAKAVFLDVSNADNAALITEASNRFGNEKIYAWLPDLSWLEHADEYAGQGASMMILHQPPKNCDAASRTMFDQKCIEQLSGMSQKFLVFCDDDVAGTITSYLKTPCVDGVILTVPGEDGGNCMNWKQQLKKRGIAVDTFESSVEWKDFKLNSDGLIPVVVQDYKTSEVLMVAYMNEEAFHKTLETGKMTYFSRSRQSLWLKGETSGHFQYVKELRIDCDNDTILAKVSQVGAACHTGARSCFYTTLAQKEYKASNPLMVFEEVYQVIQDRKINPKEGSYTNYLFNKGIDKILKKLGEEATEIVIAAKNPNPEEIKYEISDFLYHMMVLMAEKKISWEDITEELANR